MGTSPVGTGFGQWGVGPNGEPIIQRLIIPLTGSVGQTLQLEVADIYQDGTGAGLAAPGVWWCLDPSILQLSQTGLAVCISPGNALVGTLLNGAIFIQGIFVVTAPSLVSIRITGNVPTLDIGQTEQLTLLGTYTDGTVKDVTLLATWNSSGPGAAVDSTALVTALRASTITITATIGVLSASVPLTVLYIDPPGPPGAPAFKSHLTQVMLNYFDWTDARVRRGRYTIDAQLLNLAAQQIEMSSLRLGREVGATTLHTCPANIDNAGCYLKQRLPAAFNYNLLAHDVQVSHRDPTTHILGPYTAISEYDDQLPVPTRVTVDSSLDVISLPDPLIFTMNGAGNTVTQSWSAQRVEPFTPVFPDRIHFWVDQPTQYPLNLSIRITGQRGPVPAWSDAQTISSEKIVVTSLGWSSSKFSWASVSKVEVLGLPVGVNLSAFAGKFFLPMQPDPNRPYADPSQRDVSFSRYWQSSNGFLTEQYLESDFNGWRYIQSYVTPNLLGALAIEPNTWGMFAGSGATLYYFDRREPLPSNLSAAAITTEPYYGIEIEVDETRLSPVKFVILNPVPYANAPGVVKWRYVVQTPDGFIYALTPNGFFAEFSGSAGWRYGIPPALSIPLAQTGTYIFSIQTSGSDGTVVEDSTPWPNLPFHPKVSIDLSSIVSNIEGLSFDDRDRLWVWDGTNVTALQLHYDAYVIDEGSQAIYLTDPADGLAIDGNVL